MRTEVIRGEVQRLLRQSPFQAFVLVMENGDRIPIGHPENVAFDPGGNGIEGSKEFHVISNRLRLFGTFDAVTSVAPLGRAEVD